MTAIAPPTAFSTGTDARDNAFAFVDGDPAIQNGPVLTLDVLANDTGGAANILWSVAATSTFDALKTADSGGWEPTANGNLIRIVNGKVEIDLSASLAKYGGNVKALGAGVTLTDRFYYTILLPDGTLGRALAEITIAGTNDLPRFTTATGPLVTFAEDAAIKTVSGLLTATDPDFATRLTFTGSKSDAFGTLSVAKNGAWTYALKSTGAAVQSLTAGEVKTIDYPVTVSDGKGGLTTQTLTVTITGSNDAPVITSARTTGALVEDGRSATVSGQITATDADRGALLDFSAKAVGDADKFGKLAVDATGKWTFTLDRASADVQGLGRGETRQISYTVTVKDDAGASVDRTVTLTLTGTNDAPVVTAADKTGIVDLLAQATQATGQLTVTDADFGDKLGFTVLPVRADITKFGNLTVDATGKWLFTLNSGSAAVKALAQDEVKLLTFTVAISDGKGGIVRQPVTISVIGTNDLPVIGATTTAKGALVEDAPVGTASGRIVATDADRGDALTFSTTALTQDAAKYGTFAIDASGRWTFLLNKTAAEVQALGEGQTKTIAYDIGITDKSAGFVSQRVEITLTGKNDTALITNGNANASVAEDGATVTGGVLTVTDKDAGEAAFKPVADAALTGTYGHFTFNTQSGGWSYTLDNASAAVQALGAGETKTESLTVQSLDGTSHVINVTVNGTADTARPAPAVTLAAISDSPDRYDVPDDFYTTNRAATFQTDSLSVGSSGGTLDGLSGDDSVYGSSVQDTLYGADGNDLLMGNNAQDLLNGGAGNDVLYGGSLDDRLNGGSGNDTLIGGHGADTISGGDGNDTFVFYEAGDCGDAITDFKGNGFTQDNDKISVGNVDADSTVVFRQQFVWGGTTATAHGLWYADSGTGTTTVYGDTDGDTTTAEFWITLNTVPLAATDFILTP